MTTYLHQLRIFAQSPELHTAKTLLLNPSSMQFRKQIAFWAVENSNLPIFKESLSHPELPTCVNVACYASSTRQFEMLKIAVEKWNYGTDIVSLIATRMSEYINTTANISFLDLWHIQCICSIIEHKVNALPSVTKAVSTMARLYRYRVKRAKKSLYYSSINVIYNPNHPVGRICVQREIDAIMQMYENYYSFKQ